jgi:DNA-binding transcriptional ArsR family regulator
MDASRVLKTLGNQRRLENLAWLADPVANFPPQRDGDLVDDGVCLVFIADRAGISQPSASRHMGLLAAAGLVVAKPVGRWTFYRRDDPGVAAALGVITDSLTKGGDRWPIARSSPSRSTTGSGT